MSSVDGDFIINKKTPLNFQQKQNVAAKKKKKLSIKKQLLMDKINLYHKYTT